MADSGEEGRHAVEPVGLARALVVCALYIATSASLIHFNKFLMHPERFPFAMALTAAHMLVTFLLCSLLYLLSPSLFPGMARTAGRRGELLRWFAPIGCLFAVGLYCSNRAYLYCSVAFLQFMKELNVVLVFALSCSVGLQRCTRARLMVLVWIITGASIAVVGEVHFVWLGFAIQVCSQLGESGKNVLGEWIMRGSDLRLDPLTYTMFMSPMCLVVLLIGTVFTWQSEIAVRAVEWWKVLLPNAGLAFALNVSVALVIKECSAVTFVLAGLVKDMAIVAACVLVFGELVLYQQLLGFVICLGGILCWSYMRINPGSAFIQGLLAAVGEAPKDEQAPILGLKSQQV
uniref:Sugar phosphate transporter domain-containing protein n=1 Tax=Pyrodinium bahamense TaxID=73915 RepID=A0A7S0FXY1_9DINO|mmetsp:Transcript_52309/g.144913  ORF Transcript_52309/g.144913 Transcript_52309/m.144913 type:complete len:346 (+) Transcript_52309:103-1140(+)